MKNFIVLFSLFFTLVSAVAQDVDESFKPHGKPVVKVFANWHQGMGNEEFEAESGFEIKRAVIGYEYNFSPNISTKVIVDTDNPGEGKLTEVAYLRNAYVAYKDDFVNAYFGVIGIKQFKTQENNWAYRYIYKSSMDHYKFNNSIDVGMYVKANVTDWISLDVCVSNGEGAKSQQDTEGDYRFGGGFELEPLKNLTLRAYYDYFVAPQSTIEIPTQNQKTIALFLGYSNESFRLGFEYNSLSSYKFDAYDDRDLYSLYGSYVFTKKIQSFARYDVLQADYAGESEYVFLAGVEYKVVKGVKVSPNYRYGDYAFTSPADKGHYFYLNFEYKF